MTAEHFLSRLPTTEHRLGNGLTVLLREDRSAPVVAIVTHVRAGYFNEPDAVIGISHVLEHMYFKGTERLGPGEIARLTKAAGGYLNAGTIYDRTSYYTVLPSSSLERGLEIQSQALLESKIDPEELRRELEVIIQEAKRKLDNPGAVATETLYEEMFDVHRMRRWRIGHEAGLRRLTREDVWNYYRNLYRPSNIVLVVAGDLDPERTLGMIERTYGAMPAGEPIEDRSPEEPPRRGLRFREIAGPIVHAHLEWGWRTPGSLHADTPALDLLATVLGRGRASRLHRGVREAGLVSSIAAYNYTPTELGVFGIGAEAMASEAAGALRATWRIVEDLVERGVGEEELDRAKNVLESRFLRRAESVEGQASLLADWQALGDWRLAERYLGDLLETTPEDLHRVAGAYLSLDQATVLVYRPESSPSLGLDGGRLEELLRREAPAAEVTAEATAQASAEEATPREGPLDGQRPLAPGSPGRPTAIGDEEGVQLFDLPGGAKLIVKPRPGSPLVSMGLFLSGGSVGETAAEAGMTAMLARVSLKGTEARSAARLALDIESLGGAIGPGVGPDMFYWATTLAARHFDRGLELLADAALRPVFPEEELERERKIALSDLEQLRDDTARYPMRLFLQGAFPDHAYGYSPETTEASIRRLTRGDLVRRHRATVLQGRPWLVVVGDVDAERVARSAARELAGIENGPIATEIVRPIWPAGATEVADQRGKAQTALVLGFPGPDRNDPDQVPLQVLSSAVGGLGGRLFEELRSRRSLAYSVSAYPLARQLGGAYVAYIATSPEREDEARRGLLDEFERLAGEHLGADEIARAQEYLVGAWKIRSQTNDAQVGDLAGAHLLGRGLAELRDFEDRVRAVTPATARDAFARYFDPSRLVEGIVRGGAAGTRGSGALEQAG